MRNGLKCDRILNLTAAIKRVKSVFSYLNVYISYRLCGSNTGSEYKRNQTNKSVENKYNTFSNNQCNMFKLVFPLLTFSYGIKTVKGINRLSGPGLEAKDFPGMMQGGGKWPGR